MSDAEDVYITLGNHSRTYHANGQCTSLLGSTDVLQTYKSELPADFEGCSKCTDGEYVGSPEEVVS